MKRRLLASNLALVLVVLGVLEIPLALIYARHEHDAFDTAIQRDATSLAALSEEIVEHPGDHDVAGLARRFTAGAGSQVVIVDRTGTPLTTDGTGVLPPGLTSALARARTGTVAGGETAGVAFAATPIGTRASFDGAVLVTRSDEPVDHRVHEFWLLLTLVGIVCVTVAWGVSVRLARWAVGPLRRLDDNAADLGRGDLAVRADAGAGPPEVAALAATFNHMAGRLDELLTSQRRFVADASHQLRTPLTGLRLGLENLDPADQALVAATREAALAETARLTRIVDGLLALARAEGRRPERERVEVATIMSQRHEAWTPLAGENAVELRLDAPAGDPLAATIVPGHLDQILDNLIDNALDATPAGRGVTLSVRRASGEVEIHVIDEGRGMTDEDRRHAFAPFWQGPENHSPASTGLGLAIADQLARASEGTLALRRSDGGGVDAVVRFAAAE